jgi:2-keto-3-deoxy-L-rhamnonate aldolase RhmA
VAACKYPPAGRRGSGAGLATFRWPTPESYYDFADRNVLVIVNIEEAEALENVDSIAATSGIDVIFIGTSDLSFSLGLRGRQDHPKVQKAVGKIMAAARKHNKILGTVTGNPDQIKKYIAEGFLLFQASTELGLIAAGARELLEPLGKFGLESKTKALY